MSENRKDLPAPSAPNFNQRLRETIQTYLGKQGDPLDRGLTLRDLIANGIVKFKEGFNASSLAGGGTLPIAPVVVVDAVDLTPPPQPTGFTVSAAISHVFIECAEPTYTQGHGHLRTRVYGAIVEAGDPLPTFDDAVEVGQFGGQVWAMPSNPATTWRMWIKWQSVDGVLSATPAGGTNGLAATTGQDVALLLEALQGQITESQLYQTLGDRINLVDGNGAGSVNARLLAEATARGAAIQTEQTARQTADASLSQQITTLTAAVNTADTNLASAIQTEATARANADTALASQVTTLAATVGNNTAAIQTEATARANADNTLFAKYTVKVDVNGYVSGFGLASTANNGATVSDFAIRADKFYIASPSGPGVTPAMPFIVQTTATTINGVAVPVGVYMNDAFIQNGTITNAKIANLAVDGAKIANAAISTAKIADAAITTAKITDASISSAKIADAAISSAKIADAAITSAKILDASITNSKISNSAINNAKIGNAEINYLKLAGGAASVSKFANFSASNPQDNTLLTTLNLSIPADGHIIFSGYYSFLPGSRFYSATLKMRCSANINIIIQKNSTVIYNNIFYANVVNGPWVGFMQQYGSAVGNFFQSITGGIAVAATSTDVFTLTAYVSSIFIMDATNSLGYTGEGDFSNGSIIAMGIYR